MKNIIKTTKEKEDIQGNNNMNIIAGVTAYITIDVFMNTCYTKETFDRTDR